MPAGRHAPGHPPEEEVLTSRLNYAAPISQLGFGVTGVNLLQAFHDAGVEPALHPIGQVDAQPHHHEAVREAWARGRWYNPDAPSLRVWHQFALAEHVGRGKRAGWTFFELDRLTPDEVHQVNCLDVMFASSNWAAGVMRDSGVTAPVVVAQPGVDLEVFNPAVRPRWHPDLGPPPGRDTTVFINSGKWSVQKGHDVLLDAFHRAFRPDDDVLLVTACFHPLRAGDFDGPAESEKWAAMYLDSDLGRAGRVRCVRSRLGSQHELAALNAAADCGVFLSRAEGWGLGSAELLAMGKHVVMTDCTAHADYGAKAGARMVPAPGLEEAEEWPFLPAGRGRWGRFDEAVMKTAADALRQVHEDKRAGRLGSNQQGREVFTTDITWARCASVMARALGITS